MRGADERSGSLFSYIDLKSRIPEVHPLRAIRVIVNTALADLNAEFEAMYAPIGRPSIPPEKLLRSSLLQAFYTIRSERQLMERLDFDLLFRWFVGLGIDDEVWDHSVFSKNRDRLLEAEIAAKFLAAILTQDSLPERVGRRGVGPVSGYWGPWYLSEGQLYKTTDLSFTFHIVSYRRGQVDRWPEIIDTTVGIKNDPYPFGWKHAAGPNNHNNYDVAKVFRYGWPHMSAEERQRAASIIADMLHWTLTSSLQTNGSFRTVPTFFSSVGADFYFGVSFLQTIGYWDPAKRFWTEQDFPEAAATCKQIKTRLVEMALKSHESKSALTHLENSC